MLSFVHTIYVISFQCHGMSVSCVDGKRLNNGQCESLFSASNMFGYRVCFQMNITMAVPLRSTSELKILIMMNYPTVNHREVQLTNISSSVVDLQNCPYNKMYAVVRYTVSFFSEQYVNRDQFERRLMGDRILRTNSSVYVRFQGNCNRGPSLALQTGDVEHCTTMIQGYFLNYMFPTRFYSLGIQKDAKYLQSNKQLSCPRVVLDSALFTIKYGNNKTFDFPVLVLLKTQTTLEDEDFQKLENGSAVICLDDYMKASFQVDVPCNSVLGVAQATILGVLSFACTSVSLLFLAITFLTYCLFSSMRTIGGVCNMGLVVTMFAAQALYEFGVEQNEDVIVCQIIGILIHFLWLAAVFWMNASTFVLFLKLSFPLRCRHFSDNPMKLFAFAALYANGTSALIVGLNVIVSIASRGETGYGGNICYLNTMFSKLYFFKIPLGILISINICLFIFTICRLRRHRSISSTRDSKINLFSCVKLSVITGLVWLSSYLYEIFHITAFAYLFTLLVGSQGVLFFIAIVVNRNVLSLWRNCLFRKQRNNLKEEKAAYNNSSSKIQTSMSRLSHSETNEDTTIP